jgi:hypothetical protein
MIRQWFFKFSTARPSPSQKALVSRALSKAGSLSKVSLVAGFIFGSLAGFGPLASSAQAADSCIDSFASRTTLTAEQLWLEKPFNPGTSYQARSRSISAELFAEIVQMTEQLIQMCGSDCLMVGVGRSPTPLIAQAQVMQQNAINFPLSDFRPLPGFNEDTVAPKFPAPYDSPMMEMMFHELSANEEKILFEHFEAFIGSRLKNAKSVLLVDFSQSGASLFATQAYLNKWLRQRSPTLSGSTPEVHSVNIGESTYDKITASMQKIWNVESNRISKRIGSPLMAELNYARFDDWAEFTSYEVGGRYSENSVSKNGEKDYPYFRLRNTLAIMNLARTNNPKLIPTGTKLPKGIFWDLKTKTPRNRATEREVDLDLEL